MPLTTHGLFGHALTSGQLRAPRLVKAAVMHTEFMRRLIKIVAIATFGTSLLNLVPSWVGTQNIMRLLSTGSMSILFGFVAIVPITVILGKMVSAYGLFRLYNWGRNLAKIVLALDFLLLLGLTLFRWFKWGPVSAPLENAILYGIRVYGVGLISLFSFVVLFMNPVVAEFKRF